MHVLEVDAADHAEVAAAVSAPASAVPAPPAGSPALLPLLFLLLVPLCVILLLFPLLPLLRVPPSSSLALVPPAGAPPAALALVPLAGPLVVRRLVRRNQVVEQAPVELLCRAGFRSRRCKRIESGNQQRCRADCAEMNEWAGKRVWVGG